MTERFRNPVIKYTTDTLKALPFSRLYFYQTGTTTPKAVYADKNKVTSLGSVVTSDYSGTFAPIFLDGSYRVELKSSAGVTQVGWPVDNVGGEDTQAQFDDYSAVTQYDLGDIVTGSDGVRYESQQNSNLNNDPTILTNVPNWWSPVPLHLEWDARIPYQTNNRVIYSGALYESLTDDNVNHTPSSSSAYWHQINEENVWNPTVTYGATAIVMCNGVRYHSQQGSNLNQNPTTSQNYWLEEKLHYKWNAGHTYASGDYAYEGELRYVSQQSSNTNHQPSTDTTYTWWKPQSRLDLETNAQLIKIKYLSGGGALFAEWDNWLTDSSSYSIPAANTVPANTQLVVTKPDKNRTGTPTITPSGGDYLEWSGANDFAGIQLLTSRIEVLKFVSNGSNGWRIG